MLKALKFLMIFITLAITIASCKKENAVINPPASGPVEIKSNVFVVDSTQWILKSSPGQLSSGLYEFSFTTNTEYITIKPGDVIIGTVGDGYIRKVASVELTSSNMILHTSPADLSDVFKTGSFSFQVETDNGQGGSNFSYSFTNQQLYSNGPFSVKLVKGEVDFHSTWNFSFVFDSTSGFSGFEMAAKEAGLHENFTFHVSAPQPFSLPDNYAGIGGFSKKQIFWVQAGDDSVPMVVDVKVNLMTRTSALINATKGSQATFAVNDSFNLGIRYSAGQWMDEYSSLSSSKAIQIDSVEGGQNVGITMSLTPIVTVKLFGVECPTLSAGLWGSLYKRQVPTTGDWSIRADDWITVNTQIKNPSVLGKGLPVYNKTRVMDSLFFFTPYLATKISGDAQRASVWQTLPNPVRVRVTDFYGNPQAGVIVHFDVTSGGGSVPPGNVYTDQFGFAETTWTLGGILGSQSLAATIRNGYSQSINGSPVVFTAIGQ